MHWFIELFVKNQCAYLKIIFLNNEILVLETSLTQLNYYGNNLTGCNVIKYAQLNNS